MSDETKRWVVSSAVTFLAGFAIAVLPQVDSLTLASFQDGAIVGLVFAGVRAGVKALLEAFIAWYTPRISHN